MDQAGTLRRMVQNPRIKSVKEGSNPLKQVRVVAVASGKGGVGKTNVVANLALSLQSQGKRVLILDADLGLGNLDVLLGLAPRFNIQHVLSGEKEIADILMTGPGGVLILPACSGIQELTALTDSQKMNLLSQLDTLENLIDIMLIDTGAGISDNVTYFATAAQDIIIVASPEPTSLTDAYALIKILSTRYGEYRFQLLSNMVKSPQEGKDLYRKMTAVSDRYLNISLDYLGHILHDDHVPWAVREQRAVVDLFPKARASACFSLLAEKICHSPSTARLKGNLQFFWKTLVEPVPGTLSGNYTETRQDNP
jgi:flagellar biosynthesis protein FlhG